MSHRSAAHAFASFVGLTALLVSSPGSAGEKSPISSLPTLPAPRDRTEPPKDYGVPGLTVKEHQRTSRSYLELIAATSRGYCIVEAASPALQLESSTTMFDGQMELWRFVEAEGRATLERTRFAMANDPNGVWVQSKTSTELRAVVRSDGVTVWAFRDASRGGDVVLLARGAARGREIHMKRAEDDGGPDFITSECTFGAARLPSSAAKTGTLAQLQGTLPPDGEDKSKVTPRFVVDGSLAKLSRDPEPVLSVRIRRIE